MASQSNPLASRQASHDTPPSSAKDASEQSSVTDEGLVAEEGALRIVGIGASAGGLEALEEFFQHMPASSGCAFVVVQHLSPDFKSLMDELLSRRTTMPVHRAEDRMRIEANTIYLIPPKKEMRLSGEQLLLTDKDPSSSIALPIDIFFQSLASNARERAIAIVLSGTGSDGSRGVRTVSAEGGAVLVQDPETAKFDGMPRSAIDTGVVDVIASPAELPEQVLNLVGGALPADIGASPEGPLGIDRVLSLLRQEHGIDFNNYKPRTIRRRVERRVVINRCDNLEDYLRRLAEDHEELHALYRDLLIGVTKFFRDAEAFDKLKEDVLPSILNKAEGQELRIWVAGCATGEEAYSIAILLRELFEETGKELNVKIFATDVHRTSLETAAAGLYSRDSVADIAPERLERHFQGAGNSYRIVPEVRKMVVFAPHNVFKDAPFTKLDLVTCRNLLIYLQPTAQRKALALFHFGLKPGGILFLGPSESPGELVDEFEPIERHWKMYRKKRNLRMPADLGVPNSAGVRIIRAPAAKTTPLEGRVSRAHESLISQYAPPSILVSSSLDVLHTFADGGQYLEHRDGKSSLKVLDMVHAEFKLTLNAALQRCDKLRAPVSYGHVQVETPRGPRKATIDVSPVVDSEGNCFLVSIREEHETSSEEFGPSTNIPEISKARISELEHELQYTKENLQATLEEMETANEELQATNEELVASNEELQSTNEELHSVNEELYTVNAEHQKKIDELTEMTEDMENLFAATDVATVFLDRNLAIRKFTPEIGKLFQLLPQDIGRKITGFSHSLQVPELAADLENVLDTEEPMQRQVLDRAGTWYLLRITPYRVGNRVEGLVMSLVDISTLKATERQLRLMSKVFMDGADPIIIEDLSGKIIDLNVEVERQYGYQRDELLGQDVEILAPGRQREFAQDLRRRAHTEEYVRDVEVIRIDKWGKEQAALLALSLLFDDEGKSVAIASIAKDITRRKKAEHEAQVAVKKRDEFLAMLSHELRNPLAVVQNATQLLSNTNGAGDSARTAAVIQRQVKHMATLLSDLLDVSRVTQGKVDLRRQIVDLREAVSAAVEVVEDGAKARNQALEVVVPPEPVTIYGDLARIRQIHENLLTNACKYTPNGGTIWVTVSQRDNEAVIRVRDNGQGIGKEMQETIFELFSQGERTLDRSDGGMGVGLTLTRSLVELHNGTISVYSDGKDRGSEFEVRLPLHARMEKKEPAIEAPPPRSESRRRCILVIEDNPDARETLKMMLESWGHRVLLAVDGLSGLESIERYRPDVALVDIGLPKIDGYELARRIRRTHGPNSVRLVALTGYGRAEDRRAAHEAGFDAHLVKPVDCSQLSATLNADERPRHKSRADGRPKADGKVQREKGHTEDAEDYRDGPNEADASAESAEG